MITEKQPAFLWVVVKVESGIPVTVEAYQDRRAAEMREQDLRNDMHPENDETGIFQTPIRYAMDSTSRKAPRAQQADE